MKYLVSRAGQTISQDIVFSMSLIREGKTALFHEKLASHALVGFVQVKRQNFTVTSATKSSTVVFGAHCKRKDCLPVICICIIYNLLPLKSHVTLHISLVKRQQAHIVPTTADTEALAAYTSCDRLKCYRYHCLAAHVSCLLTARNSTRLCCQIPLCQLTLPRFEVSSAALVLSGVCFYNNSLRLHHSSGSKININKSTSVLL